MVAMRAPCAALAERAVHAVVLDALRATVAEKDAAMARQAADHPVDLWEADHQGDHPDFQDKPGC